MKKILMLLIWGVFCATSVVEAQQYFIPKYKGEKVEDIFRKEPSYYSWMMNGDFPLYTKKIITEIRLRVK